jgi:GTPase SAR1 family protein
VVDIGGQSVASRNLPNYLSGAALVLVVYDVTNPDSFRNVVRWLLDVRL